MGWPRKVGQDKLLKKICSYAHLGTKPQKLR